MNGHGDLETRREALMKGGMTGFPHRAVIPECEGAIRGPEYQFTSDL